MHAGQTRDVALDGVVRTGDAGEQLGDGEADRDAGLRPGDRRAGRRRRPAASSELAAAERGEAAELGDVDQADAAYTTTAPRAASGNGASSGPAKSRAPRRRATVTRLSSCVRPPAASARAVRLPLLLTGKPWISPAPTLAAPSASNSWLASMRSPAADGERAGGQDVVGVADAARPARAQKGSHIVETDLGSPGVGIPAGIAPTSSTPRSSRSRAQTARVAPNMPNRAIGAEGT